MAEQRLQKVLAAAGITGFSFLLMEIVWYRMLGPLLGGSTYTFGLILAVVLFGIGLGGLLYSLVGRRRPATLAGLATTCTLEALMIALPPTARDGPAGVAPSRSRFQRDT